MTIQDTLNENNFLDFLNGADNKVYLEKDLMAVSHYSGFGDYVLTDLINALRSGAECTQISLKNESRTDPCKINNWFRPFDCNMRKIFNMIVNKWDSYPDSEYGSKNIDGIHVYKSELQSIRVFSPFNLHLIKKLPAMPKKWTLTHVKRAIINGQFNDLRCDGKYSDDYAYDNAYNFHIGNMEMGNAVPFIKGIIEHPSGWRTSSYNGRVHIDCHSFDNNSFIPEVEK